MTDAQGAGRRAERPTLESVARRAAVSRQTVSNVLNAPHRHRPETLERVRAAIDELGYRPHLAARQLRTRESRTIGLCLQPVTDGINGAILDRFLHAFTEAARSAGYRLMLFTAGDDSSEIAQYAELRDTTDIDAFLLTSTHHGDPRTSWLGEHGVPFVTFGRPWSSSVRIQPVPHPWVDVDGAAGTRAATEHLLSRGHRRIGFLGWPVGSGSGDDRRAGWRLAMEAAGAAAADLVSWEDAVPDGVPQGREAARRLLEMGQPPTAVVCASDSLAIGAVTAASGDGDLAVTGFDDTPVAAALGLTSVAQPLVEAARQCLALLMHRLNDHEGEVPDQHRLLVPDLVIRSSPYFRTSSNRHVTLTEERQS